MLIKQFAKLSTVSALFFVIVACNDAEQQATMPQQPPTAIDVAKVVSKPVQPWFTYTTRLEAPKQVALKPRISGVVEHIHFVDGQLVQQGDLLVSLDKRPFAAQVARLEAQIASAQAALSQAESEAARANRLRKRNAISAEETEVRITAVKQAKAQLLAFTAQLTSAQLDLDFTEIKAPINGTISRADITEGNTVTANQSVLTNIVSNNKMYAYFDIDERTWNQNFTKVKAEDHLPALMQLLGHDDFTEQGVVDFIDNKIDTSTGTLRIRASFIEKNNPLRAGAFARIRIASQQAQQQILVPEKAIGTDLKSRYVLVIDENNILQYRPVVVGNKYGELRAIVNGLSTSDVIAVNGPAKVWPGMPITPRQTSFDTEKTALTLDSQLVEPLLTAKQ